ncbi:ATP-binding protein [Actinoplanes sp. CA-054009]
MPGRPRQWQIDRRRVEQSLHNLVQNALRYGGGPVAVRLGRCFLEVDDAGPGVADEHKTTVFDRLVRRPAAPSLANGEVAEVLCLVREGRLVQAVRRVDVRPGIQRQLDELVAGPAETERAAGLSTALSGLSLTTGASPDTGAVVEIAELDEGSARVVGLVGRRCRAGRAHPVQAAARTTLKDAIVHFDLRHGASC